MKIRSNQNPQDSLYHDSKNLLGILTTASETSTFPLADFFRSANEWNKQAHTWIMRKQASWKYDDSNQTDFPEATTDLVAGQQDYELPSSAQKVEKVEVLDKDGNYRIVAPITREQIKEQGYAVSEFYETDGLPVYYLLDGRSFLLFPAPAAAEVTISAGLKAYFNRDVVAFGVTATSTVPGFNTNFHRIISVGSALDFAYSRQMLNAVQLLNIKLNTLKSDLDEFYATRQTDIRPQIRISRESSI